MLYPQKMRIQMHIIPTYFSRSTPRSTPLSGVRFLRCLTLKSASPRETLFNETSGIRTPDNLIKSQVLYQLSYTPVFNYFITLGNENAQSRNRTSDTRIFSPLLYQLSYLGICLWEQSGIISNYPYKLCSISDINNFTRFLQYCQDEI